MPRRRELAQAKTPNLIQHGGIGKEGGWENPGSPLSMELLCGWMTP